MELPKDIKYTKDHEWLKIIDDVAIVGISDFAQSELGDIVFIEFPNIGDKLRKGDTIGTVEAVKTVADLFSPITGDIVEINTMLDDTPENVNNDPYGDGWIVKMRIADIDELAQLLTMEEYKEIIG